MIAVFAAVWVVALLGGVLVYFAMNRVDKSLTRLAESQQAGRQAIYNVISQDEWELLDLEYELLCDEHQD